MDSTAAAKVVSRLVQQFAEHRRSIGMSKRQLAVLARLDPKTVTLLERGDRSPTLVTTLMIAEALKLELPDCLAKAINGSK